MDFNFEDHDNFYKTPCKFYTIEHCNKNINVLNTILIMNKYNEHNNNSTFKVINEILLL